MQLLALIGPSIVGPVAISDATSAAAMLSALRELVAMHSAGVLDDEEFKCAKRKLLHM